MFDILRFKIIRNKTEEALPSSICWCQVNWQCHFSAAFLSFIRAAACNTVKLSRENTQEHSTETGQEIVSKIIQTYTAILFYSTYTIHSNTEIFIFSRVLEILGAEDQAGLCAHIITTFSFFLFLVTIPVSLCMCVKVLTTTFPINKTLVKLVLTGCPRV